MSQPTTAPRLQALRHTVHHVRPLAEGAFVLRLEKNGLEFEPGQYINVGPAGEVDMREYSVYSSPGDDYLEILVKEVEGGYVSPRLAVCRPGDEVNVDGPFGFFVIEEEARHGKPLQFIATGTGISPFHSFVRAYPELSYRVLHGTRYLSERYETEVFDRERYVSCVSREEGGAFHGRVTDHLREHPVDPESLCYLCGNCDMIYEAFDILKWQGVPPEHLFAEVYF